MGAIGRAFFLVACLKAVDGYPRPGFWATLYLFYLLTSETLFNAAMGGLTRTTLLWNGLSWIIAYGFFALLRAIGDGPAYWATFCGGFLVLVFLIP